MPWEITIVGSEDESIPLGKQDDVIARVAKAIPGVLLKHSSGPPPEMLAEMPEEIREIVSRSKLQADFEANVVSIQFYAEDTPILYQLGAEVRGDGNPFPTLSALCNTNGWLVINDADGSVVDLEA